MKVPRDVSGAQAVKALRRLGFDVLRQEGSHIRMGKGAIRVTIPNHNPILPKTLQSIIRHAGITLEEFMDNL